jgi:hypothetical protein
MNLGVAYMAENFLTEWLLTSQEGFCCVELGKPAARLLLKVDAF